MRAVVMTGFGPPASTLEYDTGHAKPERKPGSVLVRVSATSVNPIDWKTRRGDVPKFLLKLPKILGGDLAGTVVEADDSSQFNVGDKVFACNGQQWFGDKWGCYAEFATAPEDSLTLIPEGVSMEEAAAVPLAGMTAWQALEPAMPLEGKSVLVHAGAGGVGGFAVQIAKAMGAHVTTTCSTRNVDFVTNVLGADVAIDYTKGPFWEAIGSQHYNAVVDLIGGTYEVKSLPLTKPGGHFTEVLNSGWMHERGPLLGPLFFMAYAVKGTLLAWLRLGPSYTMLVLQNKAARGLNQLAELMAKGKVKVVIDRVMPLEEAAAAHEYSQQERTRGKVVLQVRPEDS